nr:YetF domain-containing protein [uncultured Halomonas sp.]
MEMYFFNGWGSLLRVIVVGVLAYAALVFFLRISGNRTLSKMNAFDLIVTVALGSTLATVLLSKDVALAEGAVAMALLISLQFIITWFSVRTAWVRRLVTGEPLMLLYRGDFITSSMQKARVTQDEVQSAIRGSGIADVTAVEAVVLETDGSMSVIKPQAESRHSSLEGVRGPH